MSDRRVGVWRGGRWTVAWLLSSLMLLGIAMPWSATAAECPYHDDLLLGVWESTLEGSDLNRACGTITVESGYVVGPAADVRMEAGQRVSFGPGVRIQAGGKLQVRSGVAFASEQRVVMLERVGPGRFSARVTGGDPVHCDEGCATLTLDVAQGATVELEAVADSGAVLWSWGNLPCRSSDLQCSFEVVDHRASTVTFQTAVTSTSTFSVPANVESSFVDPETGVRITIPAGATTQPASVRLIVSTNALGAQTFTVDLLDPDSWADEVAIKIERPDQAVTPESIGLMGALEIIKPPSAQLVNFRKYDLFLNVTAKVINRLPPGQDCSDVNRRILGIRETIAECVTQPAAALATPRCGSGQEAVACPSERPPVILVHGYQVGDGSKDIYEIVVNGQDDYWADFPYALQSVGFAPYVFRWNTAQRFEDAAWALREVAAEVNSRHPGKPPLIVAHSFGGIVARTYAQGLDTSGGAPAQRQELLGVVTIGTPHSGIFEGGTLDGKRFPNGVDSEGRIKKVGLSTVSADFAINQCRQLSCYQAGRDISMFKAVDASNYDAKSEFGVHEPGETIYRINFGEWPFEENPAASTKVMQVPLHALLGVKLGKYAEINGEVQWHLRLFQPGDGLISWQGQRVHPSRSCDTTGCADQPIDNLEPALSPGFDVFPAGVTEITLGLLHHASGDVVLPGSVSSLDFIDYAHSPSVRGPVGAPTKEIQTGVLRSKHLGSDSHDALTVVLGILKGYWWGYDHGPWWPRSFTGLPCSEYGICGVEFDISHITDLTRYFVSVDSGDYRFAEISLQRCLDEGHCVDLGDGRIRWLFSYPSGTHRIEILYRLSGQAIPYHDTFSFEVDGSGTPFELTAVPGNQQITLDWTDLDAARYNLCRAQSAIGEADFDSCGLLQDGALILNIDGPPHTQSGLTKDLLYHLRVEADFGNQRILSAEATATPLQGQTGGGGGPLNDTGITWSGDALSGNAVTCDPPAHPAGQDCHYGRDVQAVAGTLTKVGGGNAGFDFTKIANNGSVLSASATLGSGPSDWACTRDNVTGLIWEVKTADGGLRDQNNTYSWYDPNSPDGNPGTQNGGTCIGSSCDTTGFAQAVNAQTLCGSSDWRMPTLRELEGIVDYGRSLPAIDPEYFPNILNIVNNWFWSGSPTAFNNLGQVWGMDFGNGQAGNGGNRSVSNRVRLVRGGQ